MLAPRISRITHVLSPIPHCLCYGHPGWLLIYTFLCATFKAPYSVLNPPFLYSPYLTVLVRECMNARFSFICCCVCLWHICNPYWLTANLVWMLRALVNIMLECTFSAYLLLCTTAPRISRVTHVLSPIPHCLCCGCPGWLLTLHILAFNLQSPVQCP